MTLRERGFYFNGSNVWSTEEDELILNHTGVLAMWIRPLDLSVDSVLYERSNRIAKIDLTSLVVRFTWNGTTIEAEHGITIGEWSPWVNIAAIWQHRSELSMKINDVVAAQLEWTDDTLDTPESDTLVGTNYVGMINHFSIYNFIPTSFTTD